jgi:hypothetical protein
MRWFRKAKPHHDDTWQRWFAWYPVSIPRDVFRDRYVLWLTPVLRRAGLTTQYGEILEWEHKEIKK